MHKLFTLVMASIMGAICLTAQPQMETDKLPFSVTWGEENLYPLPHTLYGYLFRNEESLFVMKSAPGLHRQHFKLLQYNAEDLSLVERKELGTVHELAAQRRNLQYSYQSVIGFGKNIYMLYQRQEERGENVYEFSYRQVNANNLEEEENYHPLLKLEISSGRFEEITNRPHRAWMPNFQHKFSQDEEKMLVFVQTEPLNRDRDRYYAVKVLDDSMETIWEAEGIMKFGGRIEQPQIIFTNDGEVYLLVHIKKDPRREKDKSDLDKEMAIIHIKPGISEYDLHLLDTEKSQFKDCRIVYNSDGNNFSMACFYAEASAPVSAKSGLLMATYNSGDFSKINFSKMKFSTEVLDKVMPPRVHRNQNYNDLKLDDVFVRNNNEIVVVAERRKIDISERSVYYSNYEMNVWSFNASLEKNWHTVVPKFLESRESSPGRFSLLYDEDDIYILYNEKSNNFSQTEQRDMRHLRFQDIDVLTAVHINNQGMLTKQMALQIPDKNEVLIRFVRKIDDNKFVIFLKNDAYYRLGAIEF